MAEHLDSTAGQALDAAQAAIWEWHVETKALVVRAPSMGRLSALSGDWQLEDFLLQLEGLSRARLLMRLTDRSAGLVVDEMATFADGWQARFIGAFENGVSARGLILTSYQHDDVEPQETIEAVFQPIMRASTQNLVGFEALARWRGLDGEIKAVDRLPAGARNFLSDWLSRTMLEQSVEALLDWQKVKPDLFVQVNLNSADLERISLLGAVQHLVSQHNLIPGMVRLELTEQAALRDFDAGVTAVNSLKAAGAGIVLDDFGSGHSSFAWLAGIEADGLKLDPYLTALISKSERANEVLKAIVGLAHKLNMTVTAEGVEDADTLEILKRADVDYAQGYYFSRPLRAVDVPAFLQSMQ